MKRIKDQPIWWNKAITHLNNCDNIMKNIIKLYPREYLKYRGDPFLSLSRTIIGQQISVKAAASVWNSINKNVKNLSPQNTINYGVKNLKKCGTSERKAEYLVGIANYFLNTSNALKELQNLNDKEEVEELCKLRGIGPWSAEMFLMFCLLRQDIFPLGDLGLRKAISINYFNKKDPSDTEITNISSAWKPYRSAATWLLWKSIDPITIAY